VAVLFQFVRASPVFHLFGRISGRARGNGKGQREGGWEAVRTNRSERGDRAKDRAMEREKGRQGER